MGRSLFGKEIPNSINLFQFFSFFFFENNTNCQTKKRAERRREDCAKINNLNGEEKRRK